MQLRQLTSFDDFFELSEAFFKIAADHFIEVKKQAKDFIDELICAAHAPGHRGSLRRWFKAELHQIVTGKMA